MAEETAPLTQEEAATERNAAAQELWGDGVKIDAPTKEPVDDGKDVEAEEIKEPEPDPWAGVSPALRTEFEGLKGKVKDYDNIANRLKQAESRIGSITNQIHEAKKTAQVLEDKDKKAPTQSEIDAAAESDAEWKELRDEFPEWATAVDKRLKTEGEKLKPIQEKLELLEKAINKVPDKKEDRAVIEKLRTEINEDVVASRFPNWKADAGSKDFKAWVATQPEDVKAKCGSLRAADAIHVLDLFDKHKKNGGKKQDGKTAAEIANERKQRLTKSQLPSSGKVRQFEKAESDMTPEELRKKYAREVWAE